MFKPLVDLDHIIFSYINQKWTHLSLDYLMPFITDYKNTWWIVLLLILVWMFFQWKKALPALLCCLFAIGLADNVSSKAIKPLVGRERPPKELGPLNVRLLVKHHSGLSFPSSHASNSGAVATVVTIFNPTLAPIVWVMAALVAYSRVYVGVHFPLDIISGLILGSFCGFVSYRLYLAVKAFFGIKKF